MSTLSRTTRLIGGALLLATVVGGPAMSQTAPASGGASGDTAIQGGSGAPGSGTGTPGAIVNNKTATGIGTSSTRAMKPKHMSAKHMKHMKKSSTM